jgi:two-component system sensor histidine kinase SenX3
VRSEEGLVEVTVADQGHGIRASEQARIFERFYRVDAARSRDTGGNGLGLAIVKHICANHGGEVTVWSEEGHGSTFTMRLPAAPTSDDAASVIPAGLLELPTPDDRTREVSR